MIFIQKWDSNIKNPFLEWIHFLHPFCCIISFFLQGSICGNKSLPAWSIGAIVLTFPGAICQGRCASRIFGSAQLLPDSEGDERQTVRCRRINQLQTAGNEAFYRHYRTNDQASIALACGKDHFFTIETVIKNKLGLFSTWISGRTEAHHQLQWMTFSLTPRSFFCNEWRVWTGVVQAFEPDLRIYGGQESLKHTFTFKGSLSSITLQHQGQPVFLWHLLLDTLKLTDVVKRLYHTVPVCAFLQ